MIVIAFVEAKLLNFDAGFKYIRVGELKSWFLNWFASHKWLPSLSFLALMLPITSVTFGELSLARQWFLATRKLVDFLASIPLVFHTFSLIIFASFLWFTHGCWRLAKPSSSSSKCPLPAYFFFEHFGELVWARQPVLAPRLSCLERFNFSFPTDTILHCEIFLWLTLHSKFYLLWAQYAGMAHSKILVRWLIDEMDHPPRTRTKGINI